MPSYLVTGASRGLGFEFMRQLSQDPNNTVIGLVRDQATTEKAVAVELSGASNIHILRADITNYDAVKAAVADVAKITGGSLDYLIANAAYVSKFDAYESLGVLGSMPKELEEDLLKSFKVNVVSNIHLINLFMPIILKGNTKKVIAITTAMADLDPINAFDVENVAGYAMSKAAMNVAVGKFSAQYKKHGVLFISISPGLVETGQHSNATPAQVQTLRGMFQKFAAYSPQFTGPAEPRDAVKDVISVWEKASIEGGNGGSYVSHFGNKQWL
ncbi:hypothetical protein QQS21_004208 [Conoideocrella luteorostrata]|uniref:NAD(P)-binding protein n=1 Tax=Conoideocrella luteorostrata TaxID=1105319 RepID=A0AAJ0G002_9HYPO|nr:hypothetical protein QQS21_004208 [Conoideocrella luteorostrata]